MTAAEYIRLVEARADFIRRFDAETEAFDALVMPTVPMTAPPVTAFARDEDYARLNLKLLRNTSIINFLDRCALSLPIEPPGTAPVGLMVVGRHGEDRRLLAIGMRNRRKAHHRDTETVRTAFVIARSALRDEAISIV